MTIQSLELVEMEIRDLLNEYEFPGDDTPIISPALEVKSSSTDINDPYISQCC